MDSDVIVPSLRATDNTPTGYWLFFCPGCQMLHSILATPSKQDLTDGKPVWGFNYNTERPTITPSILVQWEEGPMDKPRTPRVCHSYVTDGKIQFLGDCTHDLKNQTVALEPVNTALERPRPRRP